MTARAVRRSNGVTSPPARRLPGRASQWCSLLMLLAISGPLVTACGAPPAPTPLPTDTSTPTATATPTSTPTPSPTPTPTPLPLAEWVKDGDALLAQSDFEAARAAYQRALDAEPAYAPALVGLARAYHWQGGFEHEALAAAQQAVEAAPEDANALAILALAHATWYEPGPAVEAAEQAAGLEPDSAVVQAALTRAYLLDRQFDAALEAAGQAITLDPLLAEAYHALGHVYRSMADYARARASFEKAIELEPTFAPWTYALGHLSFLTNHEQEAEAVLEQTLELAPGDLDAMLSLADLAIDRHDYESAEAWLQQAVDLWPAHPDPVVRLGYLRLAQDEADEALDQLRQALELEPSYWPALVGMAYVYWSEGECDALSLRAQELLDLQPRFGEGRLFAGWARLCDYDPTKALDSLRKAIDLEPYDVYTRSALAVAYAFQERWDEAGSAAVEALRLSPSAEDEHETLAILYAWQGNTELSKGEHETALRLEDDSVDALVALGWILLDEDSYAQAEEFAREVLALKDGNEEARLLLGAARYLQGDVEGAVEVLEALQEDLPDDPGSYFWLGLAYRDLGSYSEARKHLVTYLALTPEESSPVQVEYLVEALGQGYLLAEAKALADLKEGLELYLGTDLDIAIEDQDEGRTVVIKLDAEEDDEQREIVANMTFVAAVSALYVTRIDPPADNGLQIKVRVGGKVAYQASADALLMARFADSTFTYDAFPVEMAFSRLIGGQEQATVEEIENDVAETRELEALEPVPFRELTEEALAERLSTEMEEGPEADSQAGDALLTLLGVIGPAVDLDALMEDLYTEQIAGFYDPDEDAFYLVQREEQTSQDQLVIAHEYVHALQDQHFGLDEEEAKLLDSDQAQAFEALVEGDAMLAMALYAEEYVTVFDRLASISEAGGLENEVLESSPSFIQEMERFPYDKGLDFVLALYQTGGWEAVNEAYEDPPTSTEQVLHPGRYRDGDAPQPVTLPDLVAVLGAGWQELASDVMGELGLRLALAEFAGPALAEAAADGWGGDRYVLLQQGTGGPAMLALKTVWDDADEAEEFWALFPVYMAHRGGYLEEVRELLGEVTSRWWEGEAGAAYAGYGEESLTVLFGPDLETLEAVVAVLAAGDG